MSENQELEKIYQQAEAPKDESILTPEESRRLWTVYDKVWEQRLQMFESDIDHLKQICKIAVLQNKLEVRIPLEGPGKALVQEILWKQDADRLLLLLRAVFGSEYKRYNISQSDSADGYHLVVHNLDAREE